MMLLGQLGAHHADLVASFGHQEGVMRRRTAHEAIGRSSPGIHQQDVPVDFGWVNAKDSYGTALPHIVGSLRISMFQRCFERIQPLRPHLPGSGLEGTEPDHERLIGVRLYLDAQRYRECTGAMPSSHAATPSQAASEARVGSSLR